MNKSLPFVYLALSLTVLPGCANSEQNTDSVSQFIVSAENLSPEKLHIDFDGDGTTDKVSIVQLKGSASALSNAITLIHPWVVDKENTAGDDLATSSKNNFYIKLSNGNKPFIINDANTISILDTEAAKELFVIRKGQLSENGLSPIEREIKGDLLGIPTEAGIDTYLYWNGNTFVSYEPLEIP